MNVSAKRLARLAILGAIGVVTLLLASVLPAGRLALVAVSSLPVCITLMCYGVKWSVGVFAVTAALGALLYPGAAAVMYAAFFGFYPIAKSLFERLHSTVWCWVGKYALYTAAFAVYWMLARALFSFTGRELSWYVLYPLGAAVFFLYDRAYTSLIRYYLVKLSRYFQ